MSNFQFVVTINDPYNYDISGIVMDAVSRWESIITTKPSFISSMNLTIEIADLADNVLGSAGPSGSYSDIDQSNGISYGDANLNITGGIVQFNQSRIVDMRDTLRVDGKSTLYYVTLHEIGHVLGIGTLWHYFGITESYIDSQSGTSKLKYTGFYGLREYRNYMENSDLTAIPIEDDGGSGTAGGHIEEGDATFSGGQSYNNRIIDGLLHGGLEDELMTGWSEDAPDVMPLSRITIGILNDMGYGVDYTKADTYLGKSATSFDEGLGANLVCFLQGMKILCFDVELGHERYICVEDLRPGTLVVTYKHGYVPVDSIGYRKIYNPSVSENSTRMKNRLYVCNRSDFDEAEMSRFSYGDAGSGDVCGDVCGDLIITGCHSLLMNRLSHVEMRSMKEECEGKVLITDDKYRLMSYACDRCAIYDHSGDVFIWHFSLNHEDRFMNYGVYGNGVLVESCSRRMLEDYSDMTFVA